MPRWVWFMPLAVLVLAGAAMSFRYGWLVSRLTQSDVIEAYAARYMAQTGAAAADCVAVPGVKVWLEIRCGQGAGAQVYLVNRFGGLVQQRAASQPPGAARL